MSKLIIDSGLFITAFTQNPIFPINSYLDIKTGEIKFVYEDDYQAGADGFDPIENAVLKNKIAGSPDKFIEIVDDQANSIHKTLVEFLNSDWTNDKIVKQHAKNCYSGSIGRWKKAIAGSNQVDSQTVLKSWLTFKSIEFDKRMENFLNNLNLVWEWK